VQQGATLAQFRIEDPPPDWRSGQPVTVVARSPSPVRGLILPRARRGPRRQRRAGGLAPRGAGTSRGPRRDRAAGRGPRVLVAAGLRAGERVVVQGAGLVNQVR
jgi:hypothetical protein